MDKAGLDMMLLLRRGDDDNPLTPPPSRRVTEPTLLGVIWAATALSFCFVVFRIYSRIRSFRKLFADDFLVIAAWLMLLAFAILWQVKSHVMYWQYGVQEGTITPSVAYVDALAGFIPHIVTWNILYYCCVWTIKFSFLLFFRRLGKDLVSPTYWWIVTVITAITLIACIADISWKCTLSSINYIYTECGRLNRIRFDIRTFYANTAMDLVTDLLVLSIPVSMVWQTYVPLRTKLVLVGVFSVTVLTMATSIARVSLIFRGQVDPSIDWLYLWSSVEMGMAIIVACLASFRQLYTSVAKPKNLPVHAQDNFPPTIGARDPKGGAAWRRRWNYLFTSFTSFTLPTSKTLDHNKNDTSPDSQQTGLASDGPGLEPEPEAVHVKTSYDVTNRPTTTSSVTV